MNPTRTFHQLVFAQVMLGIMASCMAERNPGLLLVAGGIGAISWYVTEGPSGRTLPRWAVNCGALGAVGLLVLELMRPHAQVVSAMGHFTLALQLLMLYGHKGTREYSQLMVLSLLQMIGASVQSVSMIYGVFLAIYCAVTLVSVLVFHLTSASERVHTANRQAAAGGPAPPRPAAVAGRGAVAHLRLSALFIGLLCGTVAIAVFVVMPRTGRSPLDLGPTAAIGPRQTGFSNTVKLGGGALGSGSREPMLNLKILHQDPDINWEDRPWLIRGAALDAYSPTTATWHRSPFAMASDRTVQLHAFNNRHDTANHPRPFTRDQTYTAEITLRDPRQRTIFSVVSVPYRRGQPGFNPLRIVFDNLNDLQISPIDQQLYTSESVINATTYRLTWPMPAVGRVDPDQPSLAPLSIDELSDELIPQIPDPREYGPRRWRRSGARRDRERAAAESAEVHVGQEGQGGREVRRDREGRPRSERRERYLRRLAQRNEAQGSADSTDPRESEASEQITNRDNYARRWTLETDRVRGLAQRILKDAGLERDPAARHGTDDLAVTAALADYLRANYTYSLSNPTPRGGQDPVIAFLFQSRRGHCELFAAGLAALCRSVGVPARLVTGFRASEFNAVGGYYIVRQSNAHAWTEIDGGPGVGWHTFDATPAAEVRAQHQPATGIFASLRSLYEHIEFAWIRSVVAFDSQTQEKVLKNVSASASSAQSLSQRVLQRIKRALADLPPRLRLNFDTLEGGTVVFCLIGLLVGGLVLIRLYVVRRRRIAALQLTALPPDQRRSLAKRLRFYLLMLDMLERHGHHRPSWQSPSEFARQLSQTYPLRFDPVVALTDLFYEIRFGHRELNDDRRQRIRAHLKHLEYSLTEREM